MAVASKAKYRLIAEGLKRDIRSGRIAPGQMLPSQKELIDHYSVALGTVRQAINQLVADGWVKTKQGRGMFAQNPSEVAMPAHAQRQQTVGFAVIGPYFQYNPVSQMILHGAVSELRPAGKAVSYAVIPKDENFRESFEGFLESISALMVSGDVDAEVLEIAKQRGVRTVVVGQPLVAGDLNGQCSKVCSDAQSAGYMAGLVLALHGHKQLGFVYEFDSTYFLQVKQGFDRACEDYEIEAYQAFTFSWRDPEQEPKTAAQICEMEELSGLVVAGDMHTCRLIQYINSCGLDVPEDKSVIAVGGLPRNILSQPQLARINIGYGQMGAEAAKPLLEDKQQTVRITLPLWFEKGATLRALGPVLAERDLAS